MSSPDLLPRARSAVTGPEEFAVVYDAVLQSTLPKEQKRALLDIVDMSDCPPPVLLGVVAALAKGLWTVSDEDGDAHARYMAAGPDGSFANREYREADAATPALALLIAVLEAGNG